MIIITSQLLFLRAANTTSASASHQERVTLAVVPLERLINVFQSLLTGYPLASDSDVFTLRHPPVGFADESDRDARRQVMIGT